MNGFVYWSILCFTVAEKETDLKLESVDTSVDADDGTDVDKIVGKSSVENGSNVDEPKQSSSESTEPDSTTSDSGPAKSEAQSTDDKSDLSTSDTKKPASDSQASEATSAR